jgi:hypothetical protein
MGELGGGFLLFFPSTLHTPIEEPQAEQKDDRGESTKVTSELLAAADHADCDNHSGEAAVRLHLSRCKEESWSNCMEFSPQESSQSTFKRTHPALSQRAEEED